MGRRKYDRRPAAAPGRRTAATETLRLLRQHPLPLDQLVKIITRDASLASRVLRAAAAERPGITPDLATAIVLLGAAKLRAVIATMPGLEAPAGARHKGRARSQKLRSLKKAIAAKQYCIDPIDVARAMLRDLERS